MATKILPEIRMDQQGVGADLPLTRHETWYGWEIEVPGYYVWSRESYDPRHGKPVLSCEVILPGVMIGDPKDIHRDVSEALGLHAQRHYRAPSST